MTARQRIHGRISTILVLLGAGSIALLGLWGSNFLTTSQTIHQLLTENNELKESLGNITRESQIGYAKVLSQETRDGQLYTRLLFVETDRSDPLKRILEKELEVVGDTIHFDALIVTFDSSLVMSGQEKSLYLWRRIYSDSMRPADGLPIETPNMEPKRYEDICKHLSLKNKQLFWQEIWNLSNDPERLKATGIRAIFGNAIYKKVRPGLIYVFKISGSGMVYPETVPAL